MRLLNKMRYMFSDACQKKHRATYMPDIPLRDFFIYQLKLSKQEEYDPKRRRSLTCKAIKEMLRVSRQEGEQEGRQEGRQKGRLEGQDGDSDLGETYLADRVSKLLKASTDQEYRNKLLVEFGLA